MVAIQSLLTCLLAVGASAIPTVSPRASSPTTWSIQVKPNGPVETFTGSISTVWAKVLQQNPNFETDFPNYKAQLIAMGWMQAKEKRSTAITEPNTWRIQTTVDGSIETYTGTMETVWAKLLNEHPNFESDFPGYKAQLIAMGWLESGTAKRAITEPNTWRIQTTVDGSIETYTGTMETVWAKLLNEHPNFESDFPGYKAQLIAMGWLESGTAKRSTSEPNTWRIQTKPNGSIKTYTGDMNTVWAQLLQENPTFETDFPGYKAQLIAMGWLKSGTAKRHFGHVGPRSDWSIQVFPNGPMVPFNGTMPEVFQEVLEENPNFEKDFPYYKPQLIAMGWLTPAEAAAAEKAANVTSS